MSIQDIGSLVRRINESTPLVFDMHLGYHSFQDAHGQPYGSFEVYEYIGGFYWHACFPGCLPDGDPIGPFNTAKEAYEDAIGE